MAHKPLYTITSKHSTGEIKVFGNNHDVPIIYGFELTEKEKQEFDYYNEEEIESASFFRYKGNIYDISQFERVNENNPFYGKFDGYTNDTFFSGVGIKYNADDNEFIKVYYFYS